MSPTGKLHSSSFSYCSTLSLCVYVYMLMQELWKLCCFFMLLVSSSSVSSERVEAASVYNVMKHGATGSGQTDDSQVQHCSLLIPRLRLNFRYIYIYIAIWLHILHGSVGGSKPIPGCMASRLRRRRNHGSPDALCSSWSRAVLTEP